MKILLVDDEIEILNMLKRHLELDGYEVHTCLDPREALDVMGRELINLVITDIRMPSMMGTELMRELKKINPLVNIIIMTGYSNMSYVVECLAQGAADYFTKPFTHMETLMEAIAQTSKKIERWQQAMKS
ncbi:MAG: response regulator [Deltaproteobacteria bacterium]|nr:response regulator [Deltaproteobacteria bacterium]